MQYFISFLEGIITFISPCLLPMLPVYISYFMGGNKNTNKIKTLTNSLGFVLGFSFVFITMGAFASSIGMFLTTYNTAINILTGFIVILLGLNFLGVFNIKLLNSTKRLPYKPDKLGFVSAFIFGVVFSIGWTPCVGTFLGSALMLASQQGSWVDGVIMLVFYSLGLGIPFIMSALLIDQLKSTFDFIKRHYRIINIISASLLIIVGIMMMTGTMGHLLSLLTI